MIIKMLVLYATKTFALKLNKKKMGVALERENDPNKPIKCKDVARTLSSAHGEE